MERSKDWIEEAEGDLNHAKNDLKCGFYNWACFSAQQSGESCESCISKDTWHTFLQDIQTPTPLDLQKIGIQKRKPGG